MEGLALAPPIGALGHRGVDRGAGVAQPVVAVGDRLEREEPQAPCRGGALPLLWLGIAGPAAASTPGRAGIRGMSNGMCPAWLSPETRIQRRAHPAVVADPFRLVVPVGGGAGESRGVGPPPQLAALPVLRGAQGAGRNPPDQKEDTMSPK